ncbi:hypothetical protein BXZ70DRAFT_947573 [Cristinia sonorae]|uniref:MYND-type domain-containing protein n=1 Tax=Cristinia sonorae TaxID=1940300 RepID=A0A8K0ULE7_9AGAR|nr:hypothetical protein BXZ70DRAFT_947573 [Cristinia sonorae]
MDHTSQVTDDRNDVVMPPESAPAFPDINETTDISSIVWEEVFTQNPHSIARWAGYLYRRKLWVPLALILGISKRVVHSGSTAPQWPAFLESNLIGALLDIICSFKVQSIDDGEKTDSNEFLFGEMSYQSFTLFVMSIYLLEEEMASNDQNPLTRSATQSVLSDAERLLNFMWDDRDVLLAAREADMAGVKAGLAGPATAFLSCVVILHRMSYRYSRCQEHPYISSGAVRLCLWFWTYLGDSSGNWDDAVSTFCDVITTTSESDPSTLQSRFRQIVEPVLDCRPTFPHDFYLRICQELRNPRTVNKSASSLLQMIVYVVDAGLDRFSPFILPNDTKGIVPSIIMACLRQLCSSDGLIARNFIFSAIGEVVMDIIKTDSTRELALPQLLQCASELNFIALLSFWVVAAIKLEDGDFYLSRMIVPLLGVVTSVTQSEIRLNGSRQRSKGYQNVARVWHDTLDSLHRSHISNPTTAWKRTKQQAIKEWRKFGEPFGLIGGVRVNVLRQPSQLSTSTKYWELPRKCSWSACPCAVFSACHHPMRVCKGCSRVLYCSRSCQRADWNFGHRSACHRNQDAI